VTGEIVQLAQEKALFGSNGRVFHGGRFTVDDLRRGQRIARFARVEQRLRGR
jgi:hypothetical protein